MDRTFGWLSEADVDPSSLAAVLTGDDSVLFAVPIAIDRAIEAWSRVRDLSDRIGYWPVLLGQDADLQLHREASQTSIPRTTSAILRDADLIDPDEWVDTRREESLLDWSASTELGPELDDPDEDSRWLNQDFLGAVEFGRCPRGPWPDHLRPSREFRIPHLVVGATTIHLGLIPAVKSWAAPAYLKFGGWNECPLPAEHVALFRSWERRYQAEVVAITSTTVEFRVGRPPVDRSAALDLANQHYLYCKDLITPATPHLDALAATLLGGSVWTFRWSDHQADESDHLAWIDHSTPAS